MWRTLLLGLVVLSLGTALITACNRSGDSKQKTFVMVVKGVHPYYDPCYQGFADAGQKLGVKTEFQAPRQFEVPQQVEIIENLIARRVDGIAISALDDQGLVSVIARATDAGIKVITFDAPAPSSKALSYIGTNNEMAGYAGGIKMAELMNGEGDIAVLQGGLGAANLNERFAGFERALKEKAPKIRIVAREDEQGKIELTVNKTESLLQAHANLKGIFGVSAEAIPGAASVLRDRGRAGKVVLGGFDDMPDTIAAIKAGEAQFCIAQKTYKMGYMSVEKLLDAVNNKTLEKNIDTGVQIITKENAETYAQQMKAEFAASQPAKP